jgi:hypothetical protein
LAPRCWLCCPWLRTPLPHAVGIEDVSLVDPV